MVAPPLSISPVLPELLLGFLHCFDVLDEVPAYRVQVEGLCYKFSLALRVLPMGYRFHSSRSSTARATCFVGLRAGPHATS